MIREINFFAIFVFRERCNFCEDHKKAKFPLTTEVAFILKQAYPTPLKCVDLKIENFLLIPGMEPVTARVDHKKRFASFIVKTALSNRCFSTQKCNYHDYHHCRVIVIIAIFF